MGPYIYGKRNSIHIVDIRETLRGLLRAQKFLARVVANGQDVLLVGTKRQARNAVQREAERSGMHYVNERWLGGTLTNFRTIRARLQRLEELESLVASPQWETDFSKKMKSTLTRELRKIKRNLEGIRRMTRLPGALVAIDVRKETNAIREATALKIPTVCLMDTDGNPDLVSIPIPGNDDAMRAIELIATKLTDAIEEGKRARPEPTDRLAAHDATGDGERNRRRPRRAAPGLTEAVPAMVDAAGTTSVAEIAETGVASTPTSAPTPIPQPESVIAPSSTADEANGSREESPPAQL